MMIWFGVFRVNRDPHNGAEVLEFRTGGRTPGGASMKTDELSLDLVQKIIDDSKDSQHLWKHSDNFCDTGHVNPHEGPRRF